MVKTTHTKPIYSALQIGACFQLYPVLVNKHSSVSIPGGFDGAAYPGHEINEKWVSYFSKEFCRK